MEIKSDKERAEIISFAKILLRIADAERDSLLDSLLEGAYSVACAMTGRDEIPSSLLTRMVCEDFSKTDGVSSVSRGGMKEDYLDGYSKTVLSHIRSLRKLKVL